MAVTCKECGTYFPKTMIPQFHLTNKHGLTHIDYMHKHGFNTIYDPDHIEVVDEDDKVQCAECTSMGKEFYFKNMIPTKHFKWHGMTCKEYKLKHNISHVVSVNHRNKKLGKKFSEEHKKKLSQSRLDYFKNGGKTWNEGMEMSAEFRETCSVRQSEYSKNNPDEISRRIIKGNATKRKNPNNRWGFEDARSTSENLVSRLSAAAQKASESRIERTEEILNEVKSRGYEVLHIDDFASGGKVEFKCHCGKVMTVNRYRFDDNSKFPIEQRGNGCNLCVNDYSSSAEKEILEHIQTLYSDIRILENDRRVLYPQEIDIYLPDFNIGIEYNGLYWHSNEKGKTESYHTDKVSRCEEQGIHLINIFEDVYLGHTDEVLKYITNLTYDYVNDRVHYEDSNKGLEVVEPCIIKPATYFIDAKSHSSIYLNDELVGVILSDGTLNMVCLKVSHSHQALLDRIIEGGKMYIIDRSWFNTNNYTVHQHIGAELWGFTEGRNKRLDIIESGFGIYDSGYSIISK